MVRLTTACGVGLLVMMGVVSVALGETVRVGDKVAGLHGRERGRENHYVGRHERSPGDSPLFHL